MVVDFNPVASAVLGCNTNASFLGSETQGKAAMFYIAEYMSKLTGQPTQSLSLIYNARRTVEIHPSLADDRGTGKRKAQHFFNRSVNQLRGTKEVAAPTAVLGLFEIPAQIKSHKIGHVFVSSAVDFISGNDQYIANFPFMENEFGECDNNDGSNTDSNDAEKTATEKQVVTTATDTDDQQSSSQSETTECDDNDEDDDEDIDCLDDEEETVRDEPADSVYSHIQAPIYVTPNGVQVVQQHIHYAHRSSQLAGWTLYEYCAGITQRPWNKN